MTDEELRGRLYRIERMLELMLKHNLVPRKETKFASIFGCAPALNEQENQELIDLVHNTDIR